MTVTPEAAGSSPVDPANIFRFQCFHASVICHDLRRDAGGRGYAAKPSSKIHRKRDYRRQGGPDFVTGGFFIPD